MAGPFYVDDGGDGTTESSWATADTSINDLDAEYTFASGEIVYFGHTSVCQATNSAHLVITGPASGLPVQFISATQGSDPPAYAAGAADQIDTTEGAYDVTFDGSFVLKGLQIDSGRDIILSCDADEFMFADGCKFKIAAARYFRPNGVANGRVIVRDCVVDLTADGTSNRIQAPVIWDTSCYTELTGMTFVNAGYRTGFIFDTQLQYVSGFVSGCDCSGFPSTCELAGFCSSGIFYIANCKTAETWTPLANLASYSQHKITIVNCGPADAPTYLYYNDWCCTVASTTAIYRTGGASVEGTACAWNVITTAQCSEVTPAYTPWVYFKVAAAGTKTIDIYCTNDTGDLTNAEAWIEVEAMATENVPTYTLTTDQRATITTTAAAQTDDTTSTWNGTGPSFTYKQKLSASVVVGEEGLCRARVAVGKASIASSSYLYCDPRIFVT